MADLGSFEDAFSIGLFLFTVAPIAVLCLWRGHARANGIGAALIGGVGLWLVYDAMYLRLDPQSALVFLFVPLLQIAATIVFAVGMFVCLQLSKRASEKSVDD